MCTKPMYPACRYASSWWIFTLLCMPTSNNVRALYISLGEERTKFLKMFYRNGNVPWIKTYSKVISRLSYHLNSWICYIIQPTHARHNFSSIECLTLLRWCREYCTAIHVTICTKCKTNQLIHDKERLRNVEDWLVVGW